MRTADGVGNLRLDRFMFEPIGRTETIFRRHYKDRMKGLEGKTERMRDEVAI